MESHYWQGSTKFPEEAGEKLAFIAVHFDSKEQTLSLLDDSYVRPDGQEEEFVVLGLDKMWLVTERLRGDMVPVLLDPLPEIDQDTQSYKIEDDKLLSKLRRFSQNKSDSKEMKKILKRTVF